MDDPPATGEPAWVHGHAHEPNPTPPSGDGSLVVVTPDGQRARWSVAELAALPCTRVDNCRIVSTGHGASGPFTFGGVRLVDLLAAVLPTAASWHSVDIVSVDGFGVRLATTDLANAAAERPYLLAYQRDDAPLTRAQGLVRLIAPDEIDDALRQVKWVAQIA